MKYLKLILLFITWSLTVFSQTGYLDLKSDPSDASIYINGQFKGRTPEFFTLPVGKHTVEIRNDNYDTQSIDIYIELNEVTKQTIHLIKSGGFRVKQEQSSAINQPKGQLTIITDPNGAEVAIDGNPVSGQKTPLTIEELGAGDHTIQITGWVYVINDYTPVTLENKVHIQPNKTELLKINFEDYLGSVKINSIPEAEVYINGIMVGKTPGTFSELPEGNYKLRLKTYLGEPYGYGNINDQFWVYPQQESKFNYNFFDYYKLGKIRIHSNMSDKHFRLTNLTHNRTYRLTTNYESELLTGRYEISWGTNNTWSRTFNLNDEGKTIVFIPFEKSGKELYTISDVEGFISKSRYKNLHYKPLEETKYVNYIRFRDRHDDWDIGRHVAIGVFTAGAGLGLIVNGSSVNDAFQVGSGIAITATWLVFLFNIDSRSKLIPMNITKNIAQMNRINNDYEALELEWKRKLRQKNEKINRQNRIIDSYNNEIGDFRVEIETQ